MRLAAYGGDARMLGAIEAAKKAGWETAYICCEEDAEQGFDEAEAVLLPWPHSFREAQLTGSSLSKERVLAMLPKCRCVLHGGGVGGEELTRAQKTVDPAQDEIFLRQNAQLTAEGAIAGAMGRQGRALLGSACIVTGFGRIGQELTKRLAALGAFVIVCARNEMQMRRAHEMGAHPVPIAQIASACRKADVIFNTVPAHVLGKPALEKVRKDAMVIELASPPYGMNMELARHLGVEVRVEGGLPGRYAPMNAGAALFDALRRAMEENKEGGQDHG